MYSFITPSTDLSLMEQLNAADIQLRNEAGDYVCALRDAFAIQYYLAIARISYRLSPSRYWYYDGPDVLPFEIYSRCRKGHFTIAKIQGFADLPKATCVAQRKTHCRGNRMPAIVEALEDLARTEGLSVEFESVNNAHLSKFLAIRGYHATLDWRKHVPAGLPVELLPSPSMILRARPEGSFPALGVNA